MQTRAYYKSIFVVCAALASIIIVLMVAVWNQGPRVRLVQQSQIISERSLGSNEVIEFIFNKEVVVPSGAVSIDPYINFDTTFTEKSIAIKFKQNLDGHTEYTITLSTDIRDTSDKKMKSDYRYSFKTPSRRFVYIAPQIVANGQPSDRLIIKSDNGQERTLLEARTIRKLEATQSHIVAVIDDGLSDSIRIINRQDFTERIIDMAPGRRINQLAVPARGAIALYTEVSDPNDPSRNPTSRTNSLRKIDLFSGQINQVFGTDGFAIQAVDIEVDTYGQVIAVKTVDDNFYAVSPYNDYEPILMGSFGAGYGYNDRRAEFIFRNLSGFVSYMLSNTKTEQHDLVSPQLNSQQLSALYGDIFFDGTITEGLRRQVAIFQSAGWEEPADIVWVNESASEYFMADFKQSIDNRYLAIQKNPTACQYDTVAYRDECLDAVIEIFNIASSEVELQLEGFNFRWLP